MLTAIEQIALTPEAFDAVIHLTEQDDHQRRQIALTRERTDIAKRLTRLVQAIETGGDVATLTARMRDLETRRAAIDQEIAHLRPIRRLPKPLIDDRLTEWRRLLRAAARRKRAPSFSG